MTPFNRRTFIQSALAASGVLALEASVRSLAARDNKRTLLPVKVSRDRLIRTVVGLRPYRPEGFRVELEKLGDKLLVHHYGHGGAGITLSWGTAAEAVEFVRGFQWPVVRGRATQRKFAVIGCGVIGLSTALMLQRRYQDGPGTVTIYSKDLPP